MASLDLQKKHQKNKLYICKNCDYVTGKLYEWKRHVLTAKHLKADGDLQDLYDIQETVINCFSCTCGKVYKHRQSLYKHKKECIEKQEPNKNSISNEVVVELIKENKELRQMLLEQNSKMIEFAKEGKIITNNTTNNFSINLFLNEQCKDAINIMEFVNSIRLKVSDLEDTGRLGYVEGISKIFIKGIKELDVYKRPIHCSDLKRETLYIKDKNNWEKEDKDKTLLTKAIKIIGSKNIQQIAGWVEQNPQCKDGNSKKNDEYMNLISNTMLGSTFEEQTENINKVIKNVSKEVQIYKNL
jgi:hypothetical protein